MTDTALMTFWRANQPGENMIYKDGAWHQRDYFDKMAFMASKIAGAPVKADVIGAHTSKSVRLPVVEYQFSNGASIVVRDNFYNFAVSVKSPVPVSEDLVDEIAEVEKTSSCYCEGFPEHKVYGSYADDPHRFTAHIWDKDLFTHFILGFAQLQHAPRPTSSPTPR
jgi:hypothetical protein